MMDAQEQEIVLKALWDAGADEGLVSDVMVGLVLMQRLRVCGKYDDFANFVEIIGAEHLKITAAHNPYREHLARADLKVVK